VSDDYLGIDLASQPAGTAACRLAVEGGRAVVEDLRAGLDDDALDDLRADARVVGIDSPFGWPRPFTAAVSAWAAGEGWPGDETVALRFRATDAAVHERTGLWPLSVSTDRIGVCAFRCARLLARWGVVDRAGGAGVAEVYPAAALRCWGLAARGYKAREPAAHEARAAIVAGLRARCGWLELSDADVAACVAVDDVLDALVCALLARAVHAGATAQPPAALSEVAREEGWIHLPTDEIDALLTIPA
jgi:predicted nuclease with RNAse H fold